MLLVSCHNCAEKRVDKLTETNLEVLYFLGVHSDKLLPVTQESSYSYLPNNCVVPNKCVDSKKHFLPTCLLFT